MFEKAQFTRVNEHFEAIFDKELSSAAISRQRLFRNFIFKIPSIINMRKYSKNKHALLEQKESNFTQISFSYKTPSPEARRTHSRMQ